LIRPIDDPPPPFALFSGVPAIAVVIGIPREKCGWRGLGCGGREMKSCKWWRETDGENGNIFEYCKAKKAKCTCASVYYQCDYPSYYNVPRHRIAELKRWDSIARGIAKEARV
jgi:hypothetical protein